MNALAGYGLVFGLYMLGAVVWSLAIIWILFDADRHYSAGCLWMVFTLIAPLIAIPVYLLMRWGGTRSGAAEDQAAMRREERMASRSPCARFTEAIDGGITRVPGSWEQDKAPQATGFRPFNPHRAVMERAHAQAQARRQTDASECLKRTQAEEPPF